MLRSIFVAALVAASCAAPEVGRRVSDPCHRIYGACVLYSAETPGFVSDRVRGAFERAASYWGTGPDAITGWTVVFHGYGARSAGRFAYWGLTSDYARRVDVAIEYPTCPEVVFIHEWGHAASLAAGGVGRPHLPGIPDDPGFDDAKILAALHGLEGCP
jgi:hypothetical protein